MRRVLTLQNVPSAVAVHVLAPRQSERVLDMCAAPGSKATGLALLMCAHAADGGVAAEEEAAAAEDKLPSTRVVAACA